MVAVEKIFADYVSVRAGVLEIHAALQAWTFKPGTRNGKQVPVLIEVEMTFSLTGSAIGVLVVSQTRACQMQGDEQQRERNY